MGTLTRVYGSPFLNAKVHVLILGTWSAKFQNSPLELPGALVF